MEVKIDTIVPTPSSLRLGGVIYGPDRAWMRFVQVDLPWALMTMEVRQKIVEYAEAYREDLAIDDPMF